MAVVEDRTDETGAAGADARGVVRHRRTGVYFAPEDVAGLGRRVFVLAIDVLVVMLVCTPVVGVGFDAGFPPLAVNATAFFLAWVYLAALKVTKFPTLGYRLANVQLVDLQGNRVSLWRSTCRFLFLFLTFGNSVDLLLLSHDRNRQTLRDKMLGTFVIRRGARPLGSGPISYPTYFVGGLSFVFSEVTRPET
jgi:uncharacterized RDD family membrane protein YckC